MIGILSRHVFPGVFPSYLYMIQFRFIEVAFPISRTCLAVQQCFECWNRTIVQIGSRDPDPIERRSNIPVERFEPCRMIAGGEPAFIEPVYELRVRIIAGTQQGIRTD